MPARPSRYDQKAALSALEVCVSWAKGDVHKLQAQPRTAMANALLWLQRLRAARRKDTWEQGEKEALDAGLKEHGKELAEVHKFVLKEMPLPRFIEFYYRSGYASP